MSVSNLWKFVVCNTILSSFFLFFLEGKLKEIVKKHQGLIAENEGDATHLVHSAIDPLEEEYARPILRRERNTLLHWYNRKKRNSPKQNN